MNTVFQHLDDPVALPPLSHEQRQAILRRGESLRRRRRTKLFAVGVAMAAVVAAIVLSPALRFDRGDPPVAASPAPSMPATATVGPGRGSSTVDGTDRQLTITFAIPAGWETENGWLFKSDNYGRSDPGTGMPFGFVFLRVANIYVDGCRWRLVDPPPGPTVDDLVAAYENVPGFGGDVRDVVVDGFRGKLIDYTVPQYNADDCEERRFGIFKENVGAVNNVPNVIAQAPNQQNQIRILDVGGTRLVMLTGYPPNISAQERAELDTIVNSIQIS